LIVYVDTNIFIYTIFAHSEYGPVCKAIVDDLEKVKIEGVVSTLVPAEVFSVAIKYNSSKAKMTIKALYSLPLRIFEITNDVLFLASDLALKYNISGYDAIHLATSIQAGARHFISNDETLSKVNEIQLVKPIEYQKLEKRRA